MAVSGYTSLLSIMGQPNEIGGIECTTEPASFFAEISNSTAVPISKIFVADDSNYLVDFVLLFCIVRAIKICILIANITMISEGM
jgi:hypothetical protein